MSNVALRSVQGFADRLLTFTRALDVRRADTDEDREDIFRLRYEAYLREGSIDPGFGKRFADALDDTDNVFIFGLRYEGTLVSSFRIHVVTNEFSASPAMEVFPDIIGPLLDAGKVVIDPTRFVVGTLASRIYPELPYATVRLGFLACDHFGADYCLASVRREHQAYYRRVFSAKPMCDARMYPNLKQPISLSAVDFPVERERILARYPMMRSTAAERERLFGGPLARHINARANRLIVDDQAVVGA